MGLFLTRPVQALLMFCGAFLTRFGRRPSAATVIATFALFVALGGTGYAAVALAPNSVGSAQIKEAAVQSSDIKDGTIGSADIAAGAIRASDLSKVAVKALDGKDGKDGAQGPAGPAGARGATGATGPAGVDGSGGSAATTLRDGNGNVVSGVASVSGYNSYTGAWGSADVIRDGYMWTLQPNGTLVGFIDYLYWGKPLVYEGYLVYPNGTCTGTAFFYDWEGTARLHNGEGNLSGKTGFWTFGSATDAWTVDPSVTHMFETGDTVSWRYERTSQCESKTFGVAPTGDTRHARGIGWGLVTLSHPGAVAGPVTASPQALPGLLD
ncbi:MAG: hypothetical protein WCO40_01690 [Thermoleophilia bacterium]